MEFGHHRVHRLPDSTRYGQKNRGPRGLWRLKTKGVFVIAQMDDDEIARTIRYLDREIRRRARATFVEAAHINKANNPSGVWSTQTAEMLWREDKNKRIEFLLEAHRRGLVVERDTKPLKHYGDLGS